MSPILSVLLMVLFAVWKLLSFLEFSFIILALSPVLLESCLEGSRENSLQGELGQRAVGNEGEAECIV